MVNLRLHRGYKLPAVTSRKIGQQLAGPFKIEERIGRLAYRLDLPTNMKIHNVISVAHLEPATDPKDDPYRRRPAVPLIVDGQNEWEIERLIQKRRIRRGRGWSTQFLVRWKNCGPEEDWWMSERELLRNASALVNEYSDNFGEESGIRP